MSRVHLVLLGCVVLLLTPALLHACLWDYDTLKMERARFPTTLELITGKFLRHSPEFYQWRIEDRRRRLVNEPDNLALYDDLAVAYHKLGQNDKAIETILVKEQKHPGLYETYANLGTFYIFVGEWEKSAATIDKALAINPDAHFGRERYQKYLVEYVLVCRRAQGRSLAGAIGVSVVALPDKAFPAPAKLRLPFWEMGGGFYAFLCMKELKEETGRRKADRAAAVNGVLGMMKFADHQNPLLLEALGDLLADAGDPHGDAKQLAARAYLQASYHVSDAAAKEGYRSRAESALNMQVGYTGTQMQLPDLEASFAKELEDADAWYAKLHDDERRWIQEGKNPETEFDRLYTAEPSVASPDDWKIIWSLEAPQTIGVIACAVLFAVVVLAIAWRCMRQLAARARNTKWN
jgi:tetratricopeptide (TPR) repeat protein